MNPLKLETLVLKIVDHYNRNGYKTIPHDIDTCTIACKIIETDKHSGIGEAGNYHNSITTISQVKSSLSGEQLYLEPLPIRGLFWIRRSLGYDNAPIIAHIHSWGGRGEQLFAFVAK